jgi:hypothetical protein
MQMMQYMRMFGHCGCLQQKHKFGLFGKVIATLAQGREMTQHDVPNPPTTLLGTFIVTV